MEWLQNLLGENMAELVVAFVGSRAFIVSLVLFGIWLFFGRIVGGIKNSITGLMGSIVAMLSPLKAKRIFFNFVALIFLVGGSSSCGGAGAKVAGYEDSTWWALCAGGASLATYAFVMLIFNNIEYLREEKRRKQVKE